MNIVIIILSLVLLITLHELGHFIFARRYGVKVEEFGIGIPPRVLGKKLGETIYSLNLIPLGGFVRMKGEEERSGEKGSFSEKPIWQRAIIIVAGVVSFWVLAALIFSLVFFSWGKAALVEEGSSKEGTVLIVAAKSFDVESFDDMRVEEEVVEVDGEKVVQGSILKERIKEGAETITVKRGEKKEVISLDGKQEKFLESFFVGNYRMERMSLFASLVEGPKETFRVSAFQVKGLGLLAQGVFSGEGLPEGMEVGGPVMIGSMALDAMDRGVGDYLYFVAVIASVLAVINILPIPALDGGRLFFLLIEKLKGAPIPQKVEQGLNAAFFLLLISFMIYITYGDIVGLIN